MIVLTDVSATDALVALIGSASSRCKRLVETLVAWRTDSIPLDQNWPVNINDFPKRKSVFHVSGNCLVLCLVLSECTVYELPLHTPVPVRPPLSSRPFYNPTLKSLPIFCQQTQTFNSETDPPLTVTPKGVLYVFQLSTQGCQFQKIKFWLVVEITRYYCFRTWYWYDFWTTSYNVIITN